MHETCENSFSCFSWKKVPNKQTRRQSFQVSQDNLLKILEECIWSLLCTKFIQVKFENRGTCELYMALTQGFLQHFLKHVSKDFAFQSCHYVSFSTRDLTNSFSSFKSRCRSSAEISVDFMQTWSKGMFIKTQWHHQVLPILLHCVGSSSSHSSFPDLYQVQQ